MISYLADSRAIAYLAIVLATVALIAFAPTYIPTIATPSFILAIAGLVVVIVFFTTTSISKAAWIGLLTTFAAIISPSPLLPAFTSITGNIYYVITVLLVGTLIYKNIMQQRNAIFCAITIVFLQLAAVAYWGELKLVLLPIYFISAILIATALQPSDLAKFLDYASKLLLLLLIGGAIGFIYTFFFGGEALLYVSNEDTRQNGLYLTTFSNWYVRGVIRPAGIFDEPGALSFVVCLVAAIRHLMGAPKRLTWTLLILGFLTLSVAHIIYTALHLAQEFRSKSFRLNLAHWLGVIVTISIILSSPLGAVLDEFIFGRFTFIDGGFQGDNRSALLINAYRYLSWPVFFFGLDADCIVRPAACIAKGYLQFGDNPLAPLVLGGIVQFLPYYAVLLVLLNVSLVRRSPVVLAVTLLLLQRNEVMSYGYALLIAIFLVVAIKHDTSGPKEPTH